MAGATSNIATIRTFGKAAAELQITFFYQGIRRDFNRKKQDTLGKTLDRMKRKLAPKTTKKTKGKQDTKKDEIKNEIVCWVLDENAEEIDDNTTNLDSFVNGRLLQIDSRTFSICVDPPLVTYMSLPSEIMTGFPVIPHVIFENASIDTSFFSWYVNRKTATTTKSPETETTTATTATTEAATTKTPEIETSTTATTTTEKTITTSETTATTAAAIPTANSEEDWVLVEEGVVFVPTDDVIGLRVKCVCCPGNREIIMGPFEDECVSECVVTPGPRHTCLFDKRLALTPSYQDWRYDRFRVVTYNILASVFADTEYARTSLFPFCPPHALKSDYRRPLLMKEILGYHGDLVCLQECSAQEYEKYLRNWMAMHGYAGFLQLKAGGISEGEAFFYRTDRYQHIADLSTAIKDTLVTAHNNHLVEYMRQHSPQLTTELTCKGHVAQIHVLRERRSGGRLLCVVNTHLFFERHSPFVRLLQMAALVNHLKGVLEPYAEEEEIGVLLTGDFNATPSEPLHQYLSGESITDDEDWSLLRKKPDTDIQRMQFNNITRKLFSTRPSDVKCPMAFQCLSSDVKYTMYAPGFGPRPGATMDYIYGDRNFVRERLVPMPPEKDIDVYVGVPCVGYPSDHFALVMDLQWST